LGITFDGVHTATEPDAVTPFMPLTDKQKMYFQNSVDSIYMDFKSRVAAGRKKDIVYIDSIAQGRVWSGARALQLGLIDRLGGLQDAVDCAARLAKTTDYRLREFPEPKNVLDLLLNNYKKSAAAASVKEQLGNDGAKIYQSFSDMKSWIGTPQTRMPFDLQIIE
jgi:protease IV